MPVSKDAQISQKMAKKELSFGEKENVSCGKTLGKENVDSKPVAMFPCIWLIVHLVC